MADLELRVKLRRFAQSMERVLRRNDDKSHWTRCGDEYLMRRLKEEVKELDDAIRADPWPGKVEHVGREAADVANFAMMIADVRGALKPEPRPRG